jgi:hypothetical protein
VFSQSSAPDEHAVVAAARAHFDAEVAFVERTYREGGARLVATLAGATFTIDVRSSTDDDYARAAVAAQHGRAGGMDLLARRCPAIWRVETDADERATWRFAAILASALLGPVMPEDESTLVGVRGARAKSA